MVIKNNAGGPDRGAAVTFDHQVRTRAEIHSLQFHASFMHNGAYQVIGDFNALNNSTHTLLHIKNNSSDPIALTFARMQIINAAGGAFDDATFFQLGFGTEVASGGTAVTPVQLNRQSNTPLSITATDNNPTMTGTFIEIDRWYPEGNGKEQIYRKLGSIILADNDTMEIRVTTDHTSGLGYARFSLVNASYLLEP